MSYSSTTRPVLDMHLDDSHYSPYSQPDSPPSPDDENASLRSQALNADGTPKRPMNAFMIFARRRRPQVSAANQMMRTGEISKILSKEWNTMPMSDKQFYLDQAKKLKENFNTKYPDYVYRRRPNNSRKKRRTDASIRGVDAYGDPRDDSLSPHEDYPNSASASPIDSLVPNDHSVALASQSYRMSYNSHPSYHAEATSASAYPYYSQSHHSRHSHPSSASHYDSLHSSVSFPPSHHSPAIYHPDDDLLGPSSAGPAAPFPRLDPIKLEHSAWGSGLSARRGTLQPAPLRSSAHAHHARHWSDGSGSNPSPSAPSFPTLVAPFYPSSGTVSPSTASSSSAASYFGGASAADRDSYDSARPHSSSHQHHNSHSSSQAHHHGNNHNNSHHSSSSHGGTHSPPFQSLHQPRAYNGPTLGSTLGSLGPTLGSTLALSPGAGAGLWSSVRTGTAKSEL